jgi:hypothetical protein
MIVHFDTDIYVDQLRAALLASEIVLESLPTTNEYRARRLDRSCAQPGCDMPAALLYHDEPVCVRHWRELDT